MKNMLKKLALMLTVLATTSVLASAPDLKELEKQAMSGDVQSQFNLGEMYSKGLGVERNDPKAIMYFQMAAEQGYSEAQLVLGNIFFNGIGTNKDLNKALEYYQQASMQGHAVAQFNLAHMYFSGQGVTRNLSRAYAYLLVSSTIGLAEAANVREEMVKHMTKEQLDEAQVIAQSIFDSLK